MALYIRFFQVLKKSQLWHKKEKIAKGEYYALGRCKDQTENICSVTQIAGEKDRLYSWKLVSTDKVPEGKKCEIALRDMI